MQSNPSSRYLSILSVIFSGIMAFLLFLCAGGLFFAGSLKIFRILPQLFQNISPGQPFFQALSLTTGGLLLLPMGYFNICHLLGKPGKSVEMRKISGWAVFILTVIWLLVVLSADWLVNLGAEWAWVVEMPIYLLTVGLPIYILLRVSLGGIPLGSLRRIWSIFGFGMALGPILILIGEITILVISAFAGMIYIANNPILSNKLMVISTQLANIDSINGAQELLIPYLTNPWIIVSIFLFVSLLVPMIEEFLKPAGTWLAVRKNMLPRDGFAMGIVSGAGYALFETLGAAGNVGEGWGLLLLGRAGTDLLHIFNTGLMGWALISVWNLQGILKLFGVYFITILIHGIWNGLSLAIGFSSFFNGFEGENPWSRSLKIVGVTGLSLLSLLMFIALWATNQKMQYGAIRKNQIEV